MMNWIFINVNAFFKIDLADTIRWFQANNYKSFIYSLSFIDSLTLDIIQENMQNKTYEEAIKIIEAYQTLSSN